MLGALKRRWKIQRRQPSDEHDNDTDEDRQDIVTPRYIEVSQGKIYLGPPKTTDSAKDREILEARIAELEDALVRLQDQVNKSQSTSPIMERELKEQLEHMNRAMRTKDRRSMQVCRDHKTLQARFVRQENCLAVLQHENKSLHQRVRQYEVCLDDVMRKVVDAIVAEDNLRDEVSMLKSRVRDLEAQNAALTGSPAKGRDEGYCTLSSGQPPPSAEAHLEDLPEEPEQWLLSAEPCSAEMEDWSLSQDEMGTAIDGGTTDDNNEWIWTSPPNVNFLTTNADTQTDDINQLLYEQLVYSDDEEVVCKNFTREFYKLVSIKSGSTRSLQSQLDSDDYDDDDEESGTKNHDNECLTSPTPSEAGRAAVASCSSSDSGAGGNSDMVLIAENGKLHMSLKTGGIAAIPAPAAGDYRGVNGGDRCCSSVNSSPIKGTNGVNKNVRVRGGTAGTHHTYQNDQTNSMPSWRRSTGWTRVTTNGHSTETKSETRNGSPSKVLPPPPVPIRRSLAS